MGQGGPTGRVSSVVSETEWFCDGSGGINMGGMARRKGKASTCAAWEPRKTFPAYLYFPLCPTPPLSRDSSVPSRLRATSQWISLTFRVNTRDVFCLIQSFYSFFFLSIFLLVIIFFFVYSPLFFMIHMMPDLILYS